MLNMIRTTNTAPTARVYRHIATNDRTLPMRNMGCDKKLDKKLPSFDSFDFLAASVAATAEAKNAPAIRSINSVLRLDMCINRIQKIVEPRNYPNKNTVKYKITPPSFAGRRNFYDGFTVKN